MSCIKILAVWCKNEKFRTANLPLIGFKAISPIGIVVNFLLFNSQNVFHHLFGIVF
jgi:hypothetical protein